MDDEESQSRADTNLTANLSVVLSELDVQKRIGELQKQLIEAQQRAIAEAQQTIGDRESRIATLLAEGSKIFEELDGLKQFLASICTLEVARAESVRELLRSGTRLISEAYVRGSAQGWTEAGGDSTEREARTRSFVGVTEQKLAELLGPSGKEFRDWLEVGEALARVSQPSEENLKKAEEVLKRG